MVLDRYLHSGVTVTASASAALPGALYFGLVGGHGVFWKIPPCRSVSSRVSSVPCRLWPSTSDAERAAGIRGEPGKGVMQAERRASREAALFAECQVKLAKLT